MNKQKLHIFLFGMAFLGGLVLFACGQKGPPLPPENIGEVLSEPYDLKISHKDEMVFLSWSHRIDPVDAWVKPESFNVFMARKNMKDCEDCPFLFELAGVVPMPKKEFITRVNPGHKYYFRVQAAGKNDKTSDYSKTVQIEIK